MQRSISSRSTLLLRHAGHTRSSLLFASTRRSTSTFHAPHSSPASFRVNGVSYRLPQPRPLVALLIDGGSQEYLDAASRAGATPFLDSLLQATGPGVGGAARGSHALVSAQIPTLTNPNNVAIACGAPASVTGISGNYFLDESDPANPVERLMNSAEFLRAETVFATAQKNADFQVTILTAKDKLLALLSAGLDKTSPRTLAFSIEKLGAAAAKGVSGDSQALAAKSPEELTPQERMQLYKGVSLEELTKPFYDYFESRPELMSKLSPEQKQCIANRAVPDIYNPHISLYLLELGLQLVKADVAREAEAARIANIAADATSHLAHHKPVPPIAPGRLYYFSTTDYVQHKFMPDEADAVAFYAYIDSVLARLDELGAVVCVTADHGMNSKVGFDGQPKVVYLQQELEAAHISNRVVLPITDPYVKHHSSLGGYATIYLEDKSSESVLAAMKLLRQVRGIYTVLNREEACKAFDLPADRVGDIVVLGDANTVLGKRPSDHDLSQVPHLRSHGSMDEATVPMIINRRLNQEHGKRMTTGKTRNYHLFDMMFNGVEHNKH